MNPRKNKQFFKCIISRDTTAVFTARSISSGRVFILTNFNLGHLRNAMSIAHSNARKALSLSHSLTHSHTHTHTHTHTVLLGLLPQQKTTDSFKFWTEVTSVEYTWSLRHYQRKESVGVKLGDLGNHAMSPLLRIDVPGMVLSIH